MKNFYLLQSAEKNIKLYVFQRSIFLVNPAKAAKQVETKKTKDYDPYLVVIRSSRKSFRHLLLHPLHLEVDQEIKD